MKITIALSTILNIQKIRKVNKDWYRITLKEDKVLGKAIQAVDICRHRVTKDWIVVYGEGDEIAFKQTNVDYAARPLAFMTLRAAKLFALDYAAYYASGFELKKPRISDPKYSE